MQLNSKYWDMGKKGDCTNFVSQCMYEGGQLSMVGLDTNKTSIKVWWYALPYDSWSNSWAVANTLWKFLNQSGRVAGVDVFTSPEISNNSKKTFPNDLASTCGAQIGDLIAYNWLEKDNPNYWDHWSIITSVSGGSTLVNSHGTTTALDRKSAPWTLKQYNDGRPGSTGNYYYSTGYMLVRLKN